MQLTEAVEIIGRDNPITHAVNRPHNITYCNRQVDIVGDETFSESNITCRRCRGALQRAGLLVEPTPVPHMPSDADMSDAPKDSQATVTTHTTGHSEQCTAIVLTAGGSSVPLFFVDPDGNVLFQLNSMLFDDGHVIVDLIDVERQFSDKRALCDPGSSRDTPRPSFDYLVSADLQ